MTTNRFKAPKDVRRLQMWFPRDLPRFFEIPHIAEKLLVSRQYGEFFR